MNDRSILDIFAARLDARGVDFDRWPAGQAAEARALVARSAEARTLETAAARLRAAIARAAEAEVPNGLAFRIVADISSRRVDRFERLFGSPRGLSFAGAGFGVAAVALGMLMGAVVAPQASDYATAGGDLGPGFAVALVDDDL